MVVTLERMGHGDETIHCDTLAIVVIVSPPTPRHCVLCHLPGLALWGADTTTGHVLQTLSILTGQFSPD